MCNPEASISRSLDVAGTETINAGAYDDPNARLRWPDDEGEWKVLARVDKVLKPV